MVLPTRSNDDQSSKALRVNIDPERPEESLAKLVLALTGVVVDLLERQAYRRIERGTVTDAEAESMVTALHALHEQLNILCDQLNIDPDDLTIDLGPLGKL